ncbi:hypothetical protein GCM10010313_81760 [Streptomyces violarus]|uniref:Uncharacterized protein n=1 Tax=Streptomyces violarus TaxID=67380 RepID=A0A7W5F6M8_9ACTN|nr:DUF6415 family natural product biosynthesis protein [Streptomyces violarus]MBB3081679.1 hypothetical protein [Streptomyces violarus]GHD34841.1 hypothetical protein GCM10010313_81760 [Streptomyces violarus]
MGTDQTAPIDAAAIRRTCHRALWNPTPSDSELKRLIHEIEGYIRQLSPEVAAIVPRMQSGTRDVALLTMRYVDQVLDPKAPSANLPERLHDLGVVARALLCLHEQCREAMPGVVPIGGWLLSPAPDLLEA